MLFILGNRFSTLPVVFICIFSNFECCQVYVDHRPAAICGVPLIGAFKPVLRDSVPESFSSFLAHPLIAAECGNLGFVLGNQISMVRNVAMQSRAAERSGARPSETGIRGISVRLETIKTRLWAWSRSMCVT